MPDYYNSAFHAHGAAVHHVETECPDGLRVPGPERVSGTGNLPMCNWCRDESNRRRRPPRRYYSGG